jgi:hypothetical protein
MGWDPPQIEERRRVYRPLDETRNGNGTLRSMTDDTHQAVFDRLAALREALRGDPSPDAAQALYQCDRLEQALQHWHAEAIRFAAYTIHHLATRPETGMGDTVRQRVAELRTDLAGAGHTF